MVGLPDTEAVAQAEAEREGEAVAHTVPVALRVAEAQGDTVGEAEALGEREGEGVLLPEPVAHSVGVGVLQVVAEWEAVAQRVGESVPLPQPLPVALPLREGVRVAVPEPRAGEGVGRPAVPLPHGVLDRLGESVQEGEAVGVAEVQGESEKDWEGVAEGAPGVKVLFQAGEGLEVALGLGVREGLPEPDRVLLLHREALGQEEGVEVLDTEAQRVGEAEGEAVALLLRLVLRVKEGEGVAEGQWEGEGERVPLPQALPLPRSVEEAL